MIEELKPYEGYQAALAGLPPLPAHWGVRRTKSLLREIDRRTTTGTERLLSLRMNLGLVDHHAMGGKHIPSSSLVGYKRVLPGELVMNRMRAAIGLFGTASSEGLVSPDYAIFDVRPELKVEYAVSLFKTPTMASLFRLESRGLGTGESGFLRLYSDRFGTIRMPLPPPEEQEAIVRFLDHANRRIDQFIRAKKKLIALLNEQKQAIIHRAVTRGLDPSVKLKDSGVPWLGKVPAHWHVLRAKHLYREVDERTTTGAEELLSVSHITGVTPRSEKNVTMFKAESYAGHKLCRPGDLVINTMWAWMAALGVSRFTGIVSPAYAVYRPIGERALIDNYADAVLRTRPYVSNYIIRSTGIHASRLRLYPDQFFRIPLIVPPPEEQRKIVEHFVEGTAGYSSSIAQAEREIALIREYRTRLVADVVTGQLDVRTAAAGLPVVEPEAARAESEGDETDIEDTEAE